MTNRSYDSFNAAIGFIQTDHQRTTEFLKRQLDQRGASIGLTLTLGMGVLAFGTDSAGSLIHVVAIFAMLLFAAQISYSDALIARAQVRLDSVEQLIHLALRASVEQTTIDDGGRALSVFLDELNGYTFGPSHSLGRVSLRRAMSRSIGRISAFWIPLLLAFALGTVALTSHDNSDSGVCIQGTEGVVRVNEMPSVESGSLTVVTCPS